MAFDIETIGAALACGAGSSGGSSNSYVDASKIMTSASGSPVNIFDASGNGIEGIDSFGESKQLQTTGKNLLHNIKSTMTKDGITYTVNGDGSVTANGTNTSASETYFVVLGGNMGRESFLGKEIILSGCPIGGGSNKYYLQFYHYDKNNNNALDYGSGAKLTFTNDTTDFNVSIIVKSGVTMNNVKFYPMIRLASITDATYEPYTGGKASPNPDYPQPIESKIVNMVDVLGKNWLNSSIFTTKTSNGVTFTPVFKDGLLRYINVNTDGPATAKTYYALTDNIVDVPTESLILNGCKGGSANTYGLLASYRKEDGTTFTKEAYQTDADLPIDTAEKKYMLTIYINSGVTVSNVKFYPMLRPSFFTDGTYEPYQSQTVNLPEPIELNGIGGVRDSSKLKKFGVVIFDGSEDEYWGTMDTQVTGVKRMYTTKIPVKPVANNSTIPNMLCSHYKVVSPVDTFTQKEGITNSVLASDGRIYLYVYDENFNTSDISLWKAHLQANPMTVVYELAELEERSLPQSDIDAIKQLHTYKPNTVVMNNTDAEMTVHYEADAKTYIDNKFNELAKAIVNE